MSVERVGGSEAILIGIGVAICDSRDNLIFQLSKPLVGNGMSRPMNEIKALIEGLETALALDLKNIMIFCDYLPIYRYVSTNFLFFGLIGHVCIILCVVESLCNFVCLYRL